MTSIVARRAPTRSSVERTTSVRSEPMLPFDPAPDPSPDPAPIPGTDPGTDPGTRPSRRGRHSPG
jgi:hypothetical protein